MASDSSQGTLTVPPLEMMDFSAVFDRVLQTAGDRPEEDSLPPLSDPAADHGDGTVALQQYEQIRAQLEISREELGYAQAEKARVERALALNTSDEKAAEQATMALDSLYIAYSKQARPANSAEARAGINALFQQLENPSAYNADQFAAALRRLRPLLQ